MWRLFLRCDDELLTFFNLSSWIFLQSSKWQACNNQYCVLWDLLNNREPIIFKNMVLSQSLFLWGIQVVYNLLDILVNTYCLSINGTDFKIKSYVGGQCVCLQPSVILQLNTLKVIKTEKNERVASNKNSIKSWSTVMGLIVCVITSPPS